MSLMQNAADLPLYLSPSLQPLTHLKHAFTTRIGGDSAAPFDGLNLSLRVGDDRLQVQNNRYRVRQSLQLPHSSWVSLNQVHGNDVVEVTANAGPNIAADALWTRDPRALLAILVADCVPILLADKQGRAVAAVHAGWRGTAARIIDRVLERFTAAGVAASDLCAAVGPAIGPCCFTIGADVVQSLSQLDGGNMHVKARATGQYTADLWQLNVAQLLRGGVPEASIHVQRTCTHCTPTLFSHRRDHGKTGRQGALISLVK